MKCRFVIVTIIALWVGSLPVHAQPAPFSSTCIDGAQGGEDLAFPLFVSEDGERKLRPVSNRVAIEQLVGQRAVEYLKTRRAEKPGRFGRMGSELARHGFKPTNDVVVYRTLHLVGELNQENWQESVVRPATLRLTADTVTSSEGEVIFWSWDDGFDGTWEGSTYVERYSDGTYATYDGQTNVETEDYYEVWTEQTGYGGGGGSLEPDLDMTMTMPEGTRDRVVLAAFGGAGGPPSYPGFPAPREVQLSPAWDWDGFLHCFAAGCTFCLRECRWTGPLWAKCSGACCGVTLVYCALNNLL